MKSVSPGLRQLMAALFGVAVISQSLAADVQVPPSKRNAPKGQSLEFYPATAPQIPKPTTRTDHIRDQQSPVRGDSSPDLTPDFSAPSTQLTPTKAFAEKMRRDMDAKKNWMIPGAQDSLLSGNWASQDFEREQNGRGKLNNSGPKTILEQFLAGEDRSPRTRNQNQDKSKSDRNDNQDDQDDPYAEDNTAQKKEGGGISDFNLQSAISPGQQRFDAFSRRDNLPAYQTFRTELGVDPNRSLRDRERAREAEEAHVVEFEKMIQPRGQVGSGIDSFKDPINSATDFTRRELNPIMPRAEPSRPESSPFSSPTSISPFRAAGESSGGILGIATPAAPNINSSFSAPAASPVNPLPRVSDPIIAAPPKRIFN